MSKEALTWYRNQRVADASLKSLLYALAYEAKTGTGECGQSQAFLADATGLTDRAIRNLLVILERLEIIKRIPRNKGRYGRATDLIILSLDRNFDVSRGAVAAIRKTLRRPLPPEQRSAGKKISHRNTVPLPPERRSGESYTADTAVPYQEEGTSKVEGCSTAPLPLPEVVIAFPKRGAA